MKYKFVIVPATHANDDIVEEYVSGYSLVTERLRKDGSLVIRFCDEKAASNLLNELPMAGFRMLSDEEYEKENGPF